MEALVLFQPVHMRVFIDKVALEQVFLQELKGFACYQYHSTSVALFFTIILLTSDRQAGKAWELKKQCSSRY
jgi:hypothetical protein